MPNTKNLDPKARKKAKRKLRAAFKQKLAEKVNSKDAALQKAIGNKTV